jgi:hypothetical protein
MDPNNPQQPAPTDNMQQMIEAFKAAIPAPQVQQQAPPQLSQEQIHQMLGYWRPDMAFAQQLFGQGAGDAHTTALGQLLERIEDMIDKRAGVIAQGTLTDYHSTINPYLNDARDVAEQRFQEQLYSGDGAAFKPYEKLLSMAVPQFQQAQDYPAKRGDQVKYLHTKFGELIKQAGPPSGAPPPQAPAHGLPSFGGGASGGGGSSAPVNPATATAPMSLADVMRAH